MRSERRNVGDLDIRRHELIGVRRMGTVRSLEQGQRVSFVWDGSEVDHGRHVAVDVRVELN
jgi:hypothetical protein